MITINIRRIFIIIKKGILDKLTSDFKSKFDELDGARKKFIGQAQR